MAIHGESTPIGSSPPVYSSIPIRAMMSNPRVMHSTDSPALITAGTSSNPPADTIVDPPAESRHAVPDSSGPATLLPALDDSFPTPTPASMVLASAMNDK